MPMTYIAIHLVAISLLATILTIHDKRAARQRKWRVRESTLLLVSALGGSVVMLMTMCIIRHKTKHAKFMVGIPVIIALQIALATAALWLMKGGLA
ncbi:MAG: DUF1294 domain-containing protein [Firmicutes bacterium]|nr:DUF1294 domain-containing protein [Bacillota bacterium]